MSSRNSPSREHRGSSSGSHAGSYQYYGMNTTQHAANAGAQGSKSNGGGGGGYSDRTFADAYAMTGRVRSSSSASAKAAADPSSGMPPPSSSSSSSALNTSSLAASTAVTSAAPSAGAYQVLQHPHSSLAGVPTSALSTAIVTLPDPSAAASMVAAMRGRADVESLQMDLMHAKAEVSRVRDEKEVMRCKVLRVEGELKSLEEEVGELHHAVRLAKQDAEHHRRARQEQSNLKAQLGASRDALQGQLAEAQLELEAMASRCRLAEEAKDSVAGMYEALRERHATSEETLGEAKVLIDRLELQLLTVGEEGKLRANTHETFKQQLGVETERLAAYFRALASQTEEAMRYEHAATAASSSAHMLAPHNYAAKDDELTPSTELLIFENAKRAPLTVPLYTHLHSALRDVAAKHKALRQEFYRRGDAIAKMTVLTEDLNTALSENTILSSRVAKLETQLDAAHAQQKAAERDVGDARAQLASLIGHTFDAFEGPVGATVPSHDSAAVLSLCATAKEIATKASEELSAYRQGKHDLQAQVQRLMLDAESLKAEHSNALATLRLGCGAELQDAVDKMKALTEEACEAAMAKRLHSKDTLIEDTTAQRDALLRANEGLKESLAEVRQTLEEERAASASLAERLAAVEALYASEQQAHQAAKMDVFTLQERVLVAEQETSAAKALRLLASAASSSALPAAPLATAGEGAVAVVSTASSPRTRHTHAHHGASAANAYAVMPKHHDRLSAFEALLITLQSLHGAHDDLRAASSSAKAMGRLIATSLLPKGHTYGLPRPRHCGPLLRFRAAVVAVLAMRRLQLVYREVLAHGRTAFRGSAGGGGRRVGRGGVGSDGIISLVRLPRDTRVACEDGGVLLAVGDYDTSRLYMKGAVGGGDDDGGIAAAAMSPATFIYPTVGEAQHPAHMMTLLVEQLQASHERLVDAAMGAADTEEGAEVATAAANSSSSPLLYGAGINKRRRGDARYAPSLAECLQDGLMAVLRRPVADAAKAEQQASPPSAAVLAITSAAPAPLPPQQPQTGAALVAPMPLPLSTSRSPSPTTTMTIAMAAASRPISPQRHIIHSPQSTSSNNSNSKSGSSSSAAAESSSSPLLSSFAPRGGGRSGVVSPSPTNTAQGGPSNSSANTNGNSGGGAAQWQQGSTTVEYGTSNRRRSPTLLASVKAAADDLAAANATSHKAPQQQQHVKRVSHDYPLSDDATATTASVVDDYNRSGSGNNNTIHKNENDSPSSPMYLTSTARQHQHRPHSRSPPTRGSSAYHRDEWGSSGANNERRGQDASSSRRSATQPPLTHKLFTPQQFSVPPLMATTSNSSPRHVFGVPIGASAYTTIPTTIPSPASTAVGGGGNGGSYAIVVSPTSVPIVAGYGPPPHHFVQSQPYGGALTPHYSPYYTAAPAAAPVPAVVPPAQAVAPPAPAAAAPSAPAAVVKKVPPPPAPPQHHHHHHHHEHHYHDGDDVVTDISYTEKAALSAALGGPSAPPAAAIGVGHHRQHVPPTPGSTSAAAAGLNDTAAVHSPGAGLSRRHPQHPHTAAGASPSSIPHHHHDDDHSSFAAHHNSHRMGDETSLFMRSRFGGATAPPSSHSHSHHRQPLTELSNGSNISGRATPSAVYPPSHQQQQSEYAAATSVLKSGGTMQPYQQPSGGRSAPDHRSTTLASGGSHLFPATLAAETSSQLVEERNSQNAFAAEVLNVIKALDNKIEASLVRHKY